MIDIRNISEVVNSVMNCDMSSTSRKRNKVNAIKIYSYICRKITSSSYEDIAFVINKHHANIIHHEKSLENIIQHDQELNDATKYCMRLCRDMLGRHTLNYKDNVHLYWTKLTLEQQKRISHSVMRYTNANKKKKNV